MRSFLSFTAAALTAAGALCATLPTAEAQPAARPSACFHLSQVMATRLVDPRTLLIRTSAHTYYRMAFAGDCSDMGTEPLVLHPFDNGNEVCHAIDLDVRVRGTGQICNPASLTRLTSDEVAAIPARDLP
jgi:hypothetical protein